MGRRNRWLIQCPLMHYMAKRNGSCSTYNSTNSEWFKISDLGLEADGNTWYQANLSQYCSYFASNMALIIAQIYNPPIQYTFPGPPVASFVDASSSSAEPSSAGFVSGSSAGTTSTFANGPSSTIIASSTPSPTVIGQCMLSGRSVNEGVVK
ncbi:uncharacterized protein HD556DRAFT_1474189 [Suillus plorans]|uniref:lytic cellulose monooxygenase (C4-dehydrogenating) n=1 Tax=Suillus plorans TaxID=116603 RepID=A0A9P7ASY2_9AGAM|nr:uncharacterized protein HD556DRAFT_1474189 [Suillus plorans]KAG1794825.1 hypothetical protein HD556DRAFT_1474189 [Suillus plorans]